MTATWRRAKRVLVWTARGLALLVVLALGAIVSVLTIPSLRNAVLARALEELDSKLGIRVQASLTRLDSTGVELRDIRFAWPKEGYSAEVRRIALDYRIVQLIAPTPTLARATIEGAHVILPDSLFESSDSSDDSSSAVPPFRVERIVLREADVRGRYDGGAYGVFAVALEGDVRSRPSLRAEVTKGVLGLTSARGPLLAIAHARGHYDDAHTTAIKADGLLAGVPFALDASVQSVFDRIPDGGVDLSLRAVTGDALARVGVDPTLLRSPVSLHVKAQASAGTVSADVLAEARGAHVQLAGKYAAGTLRADLTVAAKSLLALSPILPDLDVAGVIALDADLSRAPFSVRISAHQLQVAGSDIPDLTLDGEVAYPALRVLRLSSPAYGSHILVRGDYNVDTSSAHATAELTALPISRLMPGAKGRVDGRAQLKLTGDQLRGAGSFSLFDAQLDSVSASAVSLDASVVGTLSALAITGSLRAPHVQAGSVHLESVVADVRGDGRRFDAIVDVRAEQARAALEFALQMGSREDSLNLRGNVHVGQRLVAIEGDVHRSKSAVRADLALVGADDERLTAHVEQGPTRLSGTLATSKVDWGGWLAELGIEGLKGQVSTNVSVSVPRTRGVMRMVDAALDGRIAISGSAKNLGKFAPAMDGVAADGEAQISVDGSVDAPELTLDLNARAECDTAPSAHSDRVVVHARADNDDSAVALKLFDAKGALLDLSLASELGFAELRDFVRSGKLLPPLDTKLLLTERRFDQQTGLLASFAQGYGLNLPVAVGGQAKLEARDDVVKGLVDLDVAVFGSAIDSACVAGADTRLQMHASVEGGDLAFAVTSKGRAGGELEARATTHMTGALTAPEFGPVALKVSAKELWLPGLPGFCALKGGRADIDLSVDDLGASSLRGKADAKIDGLKAGQGAPIDVNSQVTLSSQSVAAKASLRTGNRQVGTLEATIPLLGTPMPTGVDFDKPVSAALRLEKLPIGALLAVGDALGQPSGTLDADLHLAGTLSDPQPRGSLTLDDVSLSIAALAQPLQHVQGALMFEDRKLVLRGLSARDREGSLRVDGWASVDRALKAFADIRVKSEKFPLRRQGRIIGELTLDTRLRVEGAPLRAIDAKVQVAGGRLWLSDTGGGDVQSLSDHPDVHFADQEQTRSVDTGPGFGPEVALARLSITTSKDLWVMHQDFSVQLGLELALLDTGDGPSLKGDASIRRGSLMLLGRAFDIAKGTISFTGDAPPNPELDLQASYEPPSGQKLVVNVSGRSSSPIVAFSGAATTAADALAVVSGVGRANTGAGAEQKAQSDARGFATGLTAGLLSATVRRELGDWVPLISVENDAAGRLSRARAGVDASKIIPKFMRGFARGAYLEGVVGNDQTRQSGRIGLGVRLELTLPRDFMSSVGYGPGPNWSTDLAWAP